MTALAEHSRRRFVSGLAGASAFTLVCAASGRARADGVVSIQAQLRTNTVSVGDAVDLIVEVAREGGGDDVPSPTLPDLLAQGFAVEGPSTSFRTQTSWINGRSSSSVRVTYVYYLIPSKPGRFELPITVKDGGRTIRAPRVPVLEVTGEAAPTEPATPAANAAPTEARGDVFLWGTIDKPTLYVGEQLTYELVVYERLRFPNIQLRELPGFTDFWSEELPEGRLRNEVVAGVGYRVQPGLRRALFPQRAGTLTITPAQVSVGLRRRIGGQPIEVQVLPLPAEGQPAGFSANNVGEFRIAAKVDRSKVKVGEPFTLSVLIKGTGNIRVIDPGDWPELDGMRRYDPKVDLQAFGGDVVGGTRTYEFLVIPERAGALTIPPHRFSYFDPESVSYETIETAPITVQVADDGGAAPAAETEPKPSAPTPSADDDDLLLAPLVDLEALPRASGEASWLTPTRWFWGMVAAPAAGALIGLAGALRRRLAGDAASQARASRRAEERGRLAEAEAALASGDGFYPKVAQLLQALAVDRAGPEGQGLPRRALLRVLRDRGVSEEDLARLRALLDRCDAARFGAGAGESADERRRLLDEALDLLRASSLAKGRWD
ncbi:MAG: BatD family protein [Nannocystaceae bacterium]